MLATTPARPDAQNHDTLDEARRLIRGRRSIRRYLEHPIERAVLEELLTCATWAPSAHNRQPWRFCVVTASEVKQRLASIMGDRWAADMRADGVEESAVERRVAISRTRMTSAAALIVVSLSMDDMDGYPDERRQAAEYTMAVQSVALACQNLLLAAQSYGLGACWMCAPLFATELVRENLYLPAHWEPQTMITLGYPAEERESTRESLDSRVLWRE